MYNQNQNLKLILSNITYQACPKSVSTMESKKMMPVLISYKNFVNTRFVSRERQTRLQIIRSKYFTYIQHLQLH